MKILFLLLLSFLVNRSPFSQHFYARARRFRFRGIENHDFESQANVEISVFLPSAYYLESTILIPSQLFYNTFPPFSAVLKELPPKILDL